MKFLSQIPGGLILFFYFGCNPIFCQSSDELASPDGGGKEAVPWVVNLEEDISKLKAAMVIIKNRLEDSSDEDRPYYYKCLGILAGRLAQNKQAVSYYKTALSFCMEIPEIRKDLEVNLCRNLGARYIELGGTYVLDSAKYWLTLALELERYKTGSSPEYPKIMHHLGRTYNLIGDYDNSANCYLNRRDYLVTHGGTSNELAVTYIELTSLYADKLRDPDSAIKYANEGLKMGSVSVENQFKIRFNLAMAFEIKGSETAGNSAFYYFGLARRHYQIVSDICHAHTKWKDMIPKLRNNFGVLFNKAGDFAQALDSLWLAEKENRINSDFERLAQNLDNIGDAMKGMRCYEEALIAYTDALKHTFTAFKPDSLFDLPDPEKNLAYDKVGAITTLSSKAALLVTLYQVSEGKDLAYLEAALRHYDFIDRYLDETRSSFTAENSKFSLSRKAKPIFEGAITACLLMEKATSNSSFMDRAFGFAEKTKALVLYELLNEQTAARLTLDSNAQVKLFDLMRRRDWYEKELASAIFEGGDPRVQQKYRQEVIYHSQALERFQDSLRKNNGQYRELIRNEKNAVTADEIRQGLLDNQTAMVEYFLGENSNYAFILTKKHMRIVPLESSDNLRPAVRNCLSGIRSHFEGKEEPYPARVKFTFAARALYGLLISPLGELPEKLIIIPDEFLYYLPFEVALTGDVTPETPYRKYPYWVKEKTLSYNFSAGLLKEMVDRRNIQRPTSFLGGFAPEFPEDRYPDTTVWKLPVSSKFIKEQVDGQENSNLFSQEEANIANFLEQATRFKILHLVSHTHVNEQDPDLSYVRLWDKGIYLKELYLVKLNAELVVLHACETNVGKLFKGEGVASVNRGFVSAGAGSVLTTFWLVGDGPTPDFMAPFYQNLFKGRSKDEAVRQAKLQNLDKDPYYWASYIIYGDVTPLSSAGNAWRGPGLMRYIALIAVVIIGFGAYSRFKPGKV